MRKSLYILGDLDDRDIIWLSRHGSRRSISAGSALVAAGRDPEALFFVTDGRFRVSRADGRVVAELGAGDVVGEMSFVEKRPPSADVTALTDGRVLAVPRDAILAAFREDPGMAARFYRALAVFLSDRLRVTTEQSGDSAGELDEGLLDTLHIAGDRMLRLIDMLEGRAH